MEPNLQKILTFFLVFFSLSGHSQEIWNEHFPLPEKGIWGSGDGNTLLFDFEGITSWTLEYENIVLSNADHYAKTVSTSGGRFECRDINGEVVWRSEEIDISDYKNVSIQLIASETGSGDNPETKFLKAFYRVDDGPALLFDKNGENAGNWGLDTARQANLNGEKLQIVVQMNNHYASDKVILDEVVVSGEEKNPVFIEPGDVLISEVLFNPVPDGEDFVEIYNRSEKQIPLNKLYLASRNKELELTQIYALTTEKLFFEPNSYLALTKDTNGVFLWFTIECPGCFLQMEKFPSFNNDEDYVVLLNNELKVIDELFYTEDLHLPVFHDREGISLERISSSIPTNESTNWHSASSLSGYGTPGYQNSQAGDGLAENVSISFEPESFSPNDDGYNDEYLIRFQLDKPGYLCNVRIFDAAGRPITQLAQNSVLGTDEKLMWDGTDQSGQRQKIGTYIVLVELYDLYGSVKHFKDGVVLTDILE